MIRAALILLTALMLGLASPAEASSTINQRPPVSTAPGVYPLPDSGCPATATQNLWIAQESAAPNDDYKITPEQAGYTHQGTVAPTCPFKFQQWWDTTAATLPALKVYTGSQWVIKGWFDTANNVWISAPSGGAISVISSSATTDLCQSGALPQTNVNVSGNATITSFGSSCPTGMIKNVLWTGAATITAGPNITLAGGVTKTVATGDVWQLAYMGGGVWKQFYEQPNQHTVGRVDNLAADHLGGASPGLAPITADAVHVGASIGGATTVLTNFSQSINISGGGAGGMDTGPGTAPTNNFVAVYAIAGTAGVSTLGYTCDVSCPTVYPGSNMPTGYTNSALLLVWPTNNLRQFYNGSVRGKRFQIGGGAATAALNQSTTPASPSTPLSLLSFVPRNAVSVRGQMSISTNSYGGGFPSIKIYNQGGLSGGVAVLQSFIPASVSTGAPGTIASNFEVMISYGGVTPPNPTIYYQTSSDISATTTATIDIGGYTIP